MQSIILMEIRRALLSFILVLFIGIVPGTGNLYAQAKTSPYTSMATEILTLVNEHRATIGKQPLVFNELINASAEGHSHNMATKKVPFSHQGFEGRTSKLSKQIKPSNSFAENVAYGANSAKEAVEMWLNSPGHKKNIEGDYNLTGIGIVNGKDGQLYFTQIFLHKG